MLKNVFKTMAEWRGFEPPRPCEPNDLANRPLQPLEYHSRKLCTGYHKKFAVSSCFSKKFRLKYFQNYL